jgi:hypothetical protein
MSFFNSILIVKKSRARANRKSEIRFKTPVRKNHEIIEIKYLKNYEKIREQGEIENMIFFQKPHLGKNTKKRK